MKTSEVLANQIERPGKRELKQILDSDTTGPRNLLRGLGVTAGAPYFAAKDAMGKRLSAEEKAELKREVTRGNKGEDKEYKKGGMTASKRADGCAIKGKTRGRIV